MKPVRKVSDLKEARPHVPTKTHQLGIIHLGLVLQDLPNLVAHQQELRTHLLAPGLGRLHFWRNAVGSRKRARGLRDRASRTLKGAKHVWLAAEALPWIASKKRSNGLTPKKKDKQPAEQTRCGARLVWSVIR